MKEFLPGNDEIARFESVCALHNMNLEAVDAATFAPLQPAVSALYQQVYGVEKDVADAYVQQSGELTDFHALLVTQPDGRIIAGQWSFAPQLSEFCVELQDFAEQVQRESGRFELTTIYGRHLLVHPDFQGQGLGTGLRLAYKQAMRVKHPEGALLLSRILTNNYASMTSAQHAGLKPTGIFDPTSPEPRQYWYGVTS